MSGAVINASFINVLAPQPTSLAIWGNTIYVASAFEFYGSGLGNIGEYALSGEPTNTEFLTNLGYDPTAIAINDGHLFATDVQTNTIVEYNATTGALMNSSFISGLDGPEGIAISGNNMYITNWSTGIVGEYNASTGRAINASLVTGLNLPNGVTVSGGELFVATYSPGSVGVFNATTGATINSDLFAYSPGFESAGAIAVWNSNLFFADDVTSPLSGFGGAYPAVGEYDAGTGTLISHSLIPGLDGPDALLIIPEPSTWIMLVIGAASLLGFGMCKRRS